MAQPTVGYTTAEVSGTVNLTAATTTGFWSGPFQYSTEPGNPNSWINSNVWLRTRDAERRPPRSPFGGTIEGLQPGTTYVSSRSRRHSGTDVRLTAALPRSHHQSRPSPRPSPSTRSRTSPRARPTSPARSNPTPPPGRSTPTARRPTKPNGTSNAAPSVPFLSKASSKAKKASQAISLDPIRLETNTFYEADAFRHQRRRDHDRHTVLLRPLSFSPGSRPLPEALPAKAPSTSAAWSLPTTPKSPTATSSTGRPPNTSTAPPARRIRSAATRCRSITVVPAIDGQFKLSFRGQTTEDIAVRAPRRPWWNTNLRRSPRSARKGFPTSKLECGFFDAYYTVHFSGPLASHEPWSPAWRQGPKITPGAQRDRRTVETLVDGGNNAPVLVEAHLTGLTPGATYHYQLFATNSVGTVGSGDQTFVAPFASNEAACPNEAARVENSSTALPECRAYELVTSAFKASSNADTGGLLLGNGEDHDRLLRRGRQYRQLRPGGHLDNYVCRHANRKRAGKRLPNLNGPRGSLVRPPQPRRRRHRR